MVNDSATLHRLITNILTGHVAFLSECITTCILSRLLDGSSLSQMGQTIPHWFGWIVSKWSTNSVMPFIFLSHLLHGHSRSSVQDGLPRPEIWKRKRGLFFYFLPKEKSLLKFHVKYYVKFLGFVILINNQITNWLKIRTWKSERRMKIVIFLKIILNVTILQKFDEIFFSSLAKLFQEATFLIIILTFLR